MTSLGDLPEDVLVELLSLLPAPALLGPCRLVCRQWRYVVDLTTLWKRKCQREGFYLHSLDRSISDWKTFYMLCHLKRNLIRNPCAEGLFDGLQCSLLRGSEAESQVRAAGAVGPPRGRSSLLGQSRS